MKTVNIKALALSIGTLCALVDGGVAGLILGWRYNGLFGKKAP